ncbi:MAG: flagellar hook-basal body complex protein FliE [Campylobacterota bacterium]|nr:flagellar hook-basal body complex protein FliE [Campylobacterota bacterium]
MKLSEITNSLSSLGKDYQSALSSTGVDESQNKLLNNNQQDQASFSNLLKKSINEVNNTQVSAYNAMNDIATGKVENLQEAVKKIEEAELSMKLGLEVKNKALGAYKQVMAMQI